MIYTDTRDKNVRVSFKEAVLNGMNEKTGGLYIPVEFPKVNFSSFATPPFREIAFQMAKPFVEGEISDEDLSLIIADSYPFSPKIVPLDSYTYSLELFHGPTCAFKDFGARFMARVMSHFNKSENGTLHILVATSGDTGSAVGSAFHGVDGLDVTILYPEGKVSLLQEKQLSTFTGNVRALKVCGTFDDCQKLVKTAFTDKDLRKQLRLSSANSINIARLLPQSFYYMFSSLEVKNRIRIDSKIEDASIIVSVPSGNFGNLFSGLIAKEMGAPISGVIAATNQNHTVPDWIATGRYRERASVETYANAMDVGAPSNYERLKHLYSLNDVRKFFASYWLSNESIIDAINECHTNTGYIIDPHGAIAWKAWDSIRKNDMKALLAGKKNKHTNEGLTPNIPEWAENVIKNKAVGIVLETAHPAKFTDTVSKSIGREPPIPESLSRVLYLEDRAIPIKNDYKKFKTWLLENLS